MNIIDVQGFEDYMKANESAFKAENEIIQEKIALGINGVEWLVMQVVVDDIRVESLNSLMKFCKRLYKKDFEQIMKDAVNMDSESFYEKHELNWWIVIEDSLTYLAQLKIKDYNRYFDLLQWIYK